MSIECRGWLKVGEGVLGADLGANMGETVRNWGVLELSLFSSDARGLNRVLAASAGAIDIERLAFDSPRLKPLGRSRISRGGPSLVRSDGGLTPIAGLDFSSCGSGSGSESTVDEEEVRGLEDDEALSFFSSGISIIL